MAELRRQAEITDRKIAGGMNRTLKKRSGSPSRYFIPLLVEHFRYGFNKKFKKNIDGICLDETEGERQGQCLGNSAPPGRYP